jgi:hypothetical protein
MNRWTHTMLLTLTAAALIAVACGSAEDGDGTDASVPHGAVGDLPSDTSPDGAADVVAGFDPTVPGPFGVGVMTEELIDDARPTPPNGDYKGAPSRTLVTEIWYPALEGAPEEPARDAALAAPDDARPLVVYLHGFMSSNQENRLACARLACHGFVVAAPNGPLTQLTAPGDANPADVLNIPGDARFLIDAMVARGQAGTGGDGPRIDEARIGVIGTSLGTMAALMLGFLEGELDPRVGPIATVAPPGCYLPRASWTPTATPCWSCTAPWTRCWTTRPTAAPPTRPRARPNG